MLTAIGGAEDAAFLLRPSRAPQNTGKHDVRIRGMNDDPADAAGIRQAHVRPGLAGIGRFVDSIAHHVAVADYPGLASSRPYRARIRRCYRQRADGGDRLLVKDRHPAISAIRGFPDAAGCCAGIVNAGVPGDRRPTAAMRFPTLGPTKRNRNWLSGSEADCCAIAATMLPKTTTNARNSPGRLLIIPGTLRRTNVNLTLQAGLRSRLRSRSRSRTSPTSRLLKTLVCAALRQGTTSEVAEKLSFAPVLKGRSLSHALSEVEGCAVQVLYFGHSAGNRPFDSFINLQRLAPDGFDSRFGTRWLL